MTNAATREAIVYRATNTLNGKTYIGYTARGLEKRRYQHLWSARKGEGRYFHSAIRKHGEENFVFEVLASFGDDEERAKVYEREAIVTYKPEYNLSHGGEGGTLHETARKKIAEANRRRVITDEIRKNIGNAQRGTKRTEETRAKMRAAQIGKKHSPETIQKMREVCGHEVTDEARRKMSAARKGRVSPNKGNKWSDELRARVSLLRKGRPAHNKGSKHSEETRQKISSALRSHEFQVTDKRRAASVANAIKARSALSKPVVCLTDGRVFDSSNHADRFYGFRIGSVNSAVRRKSKRTHGLCFEYKVQA